jgi:hypothetical protein
MSSGVSFACYQPRLPRSAKINRKGFALYGGAVFKYVGTQYGIAGMIFRTTEVDTGNLNANTIEIKAVQDIFAIGATAYLPPDGGGWEPPVLTATNITVERAMEQPYLFHETDSTRIFTVAAPANGAQLGYNLHTHAASDPYSLKLPGTPFTPTGTLQASYTSSAFDTTGTLTITPTSGMEDLPDAVLPSEITAGTRGLLLIGDEILAYESYTIDGSGDYVFDNVWGGLLDTVLGTHVTGDRVWFFSEGLALDPTEYASGATVKAKLASIGAEGALAIASCTELTV